VTEGVSSVLASLDELSTEQICDFVGNLSDGDAEAIRTDWSIWARPEQLLPPGVWRTWFIRCGRGWGKTRTGAGAVHEHARHPEWLQGGDIVIAGRTFAKTQQEMVEGPAGILASSPSDFKPEWYCGKHTGLLVWPNGVRGICLTGDKPEAFRGPNAAFAWLDELAHYDDPDAVWSILQFALRIGVARSLVTTTPLPNPIMTEIAAEKGTVLTTGSLYDNEANLAPQFVEYIIDRFEGTRMGRQELHGEVLEDSPGALWSSESLERNRVQNSPDLVRIVVACDPAVTDPTDKTDLEREKIAETGIIVAGIDRHDHGYVLADRSGQYSPEDWGEILVEEFERWYADCIVGEVNNGGDLVERNVRASAKTMKNADGTTGKHVTYKAVRATRGKQLRAEPVATLAEKNKLHNVGQFPKLEDQLTKWEPGKKSPDRLDAYVWAFTDLFLSDEPEKDVGPLSAYST
jgi:phage terminase large subunit-like protein